MNEQNNATIEQLWYTWSDIGLDTIRAGFRVRAASQGLSDIRSERVQKLDKYLRYILPEAVNPAIDPEKAPICLSFIITATERMLVQKKYVGKDAVGRYGSFFIHLLVDLPATFSARDAIALWHSPFLQYSDKELCNPPRTELKRVSSAELMQNRVSTAYTMQEKMLLQTYLPNIFQAYLMKKPLQESKKASLPNIFRAYLMKKPLQESKKASAALQQKLYIAAPDTVIAQSITALTCCLPEHLIKDLTFSTYERDVTEAQTEIVGTCKPSGSTQADEMYTIQLFPKQYCQEKVAINCYTGEQSLLTNPLLFAQNPLAGDFALYATQNFLYDNDMAPEFLDLLKIANEEYPDIDVDQLLDLYKTLIVEAQQKPSPQEVEKALSPRSDADYVQSARLFSRRKGYREVLIELALYKPNWWEHFGKERVNNLYQYTLRIHIPILVDALRQIQQQVLPHVVGCVRDGNLTNDVSFEILVDIMRHAAPPTLYREQWFPLLQQFALIPTVFSFMRRHWNVYAELIPLWCTSASFSEKNYKERAHFFALSWEDFSPFLSLSLPLEWTERAIQSLLKHAPAPPSKEVIATLEQNAQYTVLAAFLQQLVHHTQYRSTAEILFKILVKYGYERKVELMGVLLEADSGEGEKYVERVIKTAQLKTLQEIDTFFTRYGQTYIRLYSALPVLFDLFIDYTGISQERRIAVLETLDIWLKTSLYEDSLERLLSVTQLTRDEQFWFLKRFGHVYLARYPHSAVLLEFVINFHDYLYTVDIDIFQDALSPQQHTPTEELLRFLCNTQLPIAVTRSSDWIRWYWLAVFVRQPATLRTNQKDVIISVCWLLSKYTELKETNAYRKLVRKLAYACVQDEDTFATTLSSLQHTMLPRDFVFLLLEIAVSASNGVQKRLYEQTLLERCLLFAYQYEKGVFKENAQQEYFMQKFLDILLQDVSAKTSKRLLLRTKAWSNNFYSEWHNYKPQSSFQPVQSTPSWFEQLQLRRERDKAFKQMSEALKADNEMIAYVSTDHMATLNSYNQEIPTEWWEKIDNALQELNRNDEAQWQQDEIQYAQQPIAHSPIALKELQKALRGENIEHIVRVTTKYIRVLHTHHQAIPDEWWRQINAAFAFSLACEEAENGTNEEMEQAIINASNVIHDLASFFQHSPKLTAHERRRTQLALYYVAYCEAQRRKESSIQHIIATLYQQKTVAAIQSETHSPDAAEPPKGILQNFLEWFR